MIGNPEWKEFLKFAEDFYNDCLQLAVKVAGGENAPTIQILLQQLSPDLLTLFDAWREEKLISP